MKCFALLLVAVLSVQAGKVTIKGTCVDCNQPETTTPRAPQPSRGSSGGHGRHQTTIKPKPLPARRVVSHADNDDDDWSLGGGNSWGLHQSIGGGRDGGVSQHITGGHRYKRQWGGRQIIRTGGGDGDGGWGGGPITTIDSRGQPGTFVRNNDCVGCNIRG
ncbi:uncharacterized protein Dwil_GK23236 [Drosophila willistoni]|uniref:Bomanin bicipital 3 n=1 Tax=Drosophila willistoni TaxID=7260 RepID=B4NN12_DROWI|nr:uncharacterized protein LOC6652406 [Drosophila willistoni]EDW85751.1 uncharacterized protein Dwil_GK23236 [Drosophila willistoni]